jgi:hypothetical protein
MGDGQSEGVAHITSQIARATNQINIVPSCGPCHCRRPGVSDANRKLIYFNIALLNLWFAISTFGYLAAPRKIFFDFCGPGRIKAEDFVCAPLSDSQRNA